MKADWQTTPLVLAGMLCLALALMHLEIIYIGAPGYRYFGAGEQMAMLAEEGSWLPGLLTAGVALLLGAFAAYAFSGSGIIRRLPWLRFMLLLICGIFLLRGLAAFPQALALLGGTETSAKDFSFSLVSLVVGLLFAWGLRIRWRLLKSQANDA